MGNNTTSKETTKETNKETTKETTKETSSPGLEETWDSIDGPAVRQVTLLLLTNISDRNENISWQFDRLLQVTAVVVGCGNRGQNYAAFALDFPSRLKIVGVAEPVSQLFILSVWIFQ